MERGETETLNDVCVGGGGKSGNFFAQKHGFSVEIISCEKYCGKTGPSPGVGMWQSCGALP
jgi:hypothetical protein